MRIFNLLFFLQAYADPHKSNAPSQQNFKWSTPVNSFCAQTASGKDLVLAPGETQTLFNTIRSLAQDNTTEYSLALKPLTSTTYVLSWVGGTAPDFRTPRNIGIDATTQVQATVNGPVVTFTSPAGTPFNLSSVVVGDFVFLGSLFNALNQGVWQIISVTGSSFSISNAIGVNEGPILLGSGFASQVQIFSSAGVQIGDTLQITSGFSPVSQGSYQITQVYANSLEFSSTAVLPAEGPITTEVSVYESALKFVYVQSDQQCNLILNGGGAEHLSPLINQNTQGPAIFARTDTIYSMSVTNTSLNPAKLWIAMVG